MGGDHMCPVCSATFTRPQHVARHMRSHTGDRPYACQMCGDRFARSDLLSRHVNKCHTPGGLPTASTRRNQARNQAAAQEDKKRRPCEACTLQSTKCDFGRPCNNCSSRGSKCAYSKARRPRRNTNPSPTSATSSLPENNPLSHESVPINSFGTYQEDIPPFSFHYPPQNNSLSLPHVFDPSLSVPNPSSGTFMASPEAPSLSFSAATSDSAESSPWNGLDLMGLNSVPNASFDASIFHDPNAPSFTSAHKVQPHLNHNHFNYSLDQSPQSDHLSLTSLHQRPPSATIQRHPIHHQRHRSSPSLDGSYPLLNHALLRAQGQQYPAITPSRLYMHRGSVSASDSGTDYESPGRPGTASEYTDFPSPMSLVGSETGSATGIGRSIDDMSLHEPGVNSLMSMGSMMLPGIGMGTGLTPAVESPSRPSMTQRQSTFGDLRAFWSECMDNQQSNVGSNANGNNENRGHSLAKMTSMPCLKTPVGDATPRASAADPLARLGQQRPQSGAGQTPRMANHTDPKGLEQYQSALNARPTPSLHLAPKMKAAAAKKEESESNNNTNDPGISAPFPPGAQADAWRSLMSSSGSYVATSDNNRPNYKRLPSQTLGPENSKRPNRGDGEDNEVFTDDEDENADYKASQQEWHRRMSLPVMGRSGNGVERLHQPMPVPANRQNGVLH